MFAHSAGVAPVADSVQPQNALSPKQTAFCYFPQREGSRLDRRGLLKPPADRLIDMNGRGGLARSAGPFRLRWRCFSRTLLDPATGSLCSHAGAGQPTAYFSRRHPQGTTGSVALFLRQSSAVAAFPPERRFVWPS